MEELVGLSFGSFKIFNQVKSIETEFLISQGDLAALGNCTGRLTGGGHCLSASKLKSIR